METWMIYLGCISSIIMGAIVMWIAFFFFAREKDFTAAEFGGFISAFFGGAILQVYTTQLTDETKFIFWFYPIGLLLGMIAYKISGGKVKVEELVEYNRG